jgi:regulator of nucleoside diphosphate kinase
MLFNTGLTSVQDRNRLIEVVDRARASWLTYATQLASFRLGLRQAQALSPEAVPADIITMNSRFAMSGPGSGGRICYTLVYPEAAAPTRGKLSVLTPMGMALLGARAGDEVCWMSSDGPQVGKVHQVLYQPEAAGHHHL